MLTVLLLAWSVAATAAESPIVIQDFSEGLTGVRAANPAVHLTLGHDPSVHSDPILLVEYPAPTGDPAGRDVQCTAMNQDWTDGHAIAFDINAAHDMRLSVSFVDRNGVVYTAWTELKGGEYQHVRIPFDEIRPNPYFQPPGAKTGAPLDVSSVKFVAFAPQDQTPGLLLVGPFVVAD